MEHSNSLRQLPFDESGFLADPTLWSRDVAQQIANQDGLGPLTKPQWQIIYFLRENYIESHALPPMAHVCRVLGIEPHGVDHLFHSEKEAWRVSGLPDPGEEAKTLMS